MLTQLKKQKTAEAMRKVAKDPEYRKKLSQATKKKLKDPEYRKNVSAGLKKSYDGRIQTKTECKFQRGTSFP